MHYITDPKAQIPYANPVVWFQLMKELKKNPVWPFTQVAQNVLQLKTRDIQFFYAFILLIVNTICLFYLFFVSGEKNVIVSRSSSITIPTWLCFTHIESIKKPP